MSRTNRHERYPLGLCPVCGMDSGERVQSEKAPFKHTVMNPDLYDDVTPGFLVGGECYCPECFKEWAKDEIDSDPEAVAAAMGIAVLTIPEG